MADLTDEEVLEEERSFLLRSLDDLDAEHADGNIDDEIYRRLRDDYTARVAGVLRRLDGESIIDPGATAALGARATGRTPPLLTALGVVAFAAAAAITLAFALGARLPGETITGRQGESAAAGEARQVRQLRAAIRLRPDVATTRLALARTLMGRADYRGALTQFQEAARLEPTNPEPFAYSGWLIRLQGFPEQGLTLVDQALEVRPDYPDARFFKGLILLRDQHDPDAAIPQFQQYLVSSPDSPLANQVRRLLAEAVEAQRTPGADSPSPSPTPSQPSP